MQIIARPIRFFTWQTSHSAQIEGLGVIQCPANTNHYFIVRLNCRWDTRKTSHIRLVGCFFPASWQKHASFRAFDFHISLPLETSAYSKLLDPSKKNPKKTKQQKFSRKSLRAPPQFSRFHRPHRGWEKITHSHSNPRGEVMSDLPLIQSTSHFICLLTYRTTELLGLEGTSADHLVQPFSQSRVT